MTNIDKCAAEINDNLKKYENPTEDEVVRFIYLFLGKKISFDINWVYGMDYIRRGIYGCAGSKENIENIISDDNWEMICKDTAYFISYIGKKVGVNIEVVQPKPTYYDPLPHVYNKVIRKDGSSYCIDLDSDLYCIAMNMRTDYFGFDDKSYKQLFSRKQLEKIDSKLGYITKEKTYTDEYFYPLWNYISRLDSVHDIIKTILENPSPYNNLNLGFHERKMYILSLINSYRNNPMNHMKINWKWLDFYYNIDSNIVPKEIIYVEDENDKTFYEFNSKEGNYNQISEEEFAEMLSNGLCLSNVYKYEHVNAHDKYKWINELKNKHLSKN